MAGVPRRIRIQQSLAFTVRLTPEIRVPQPFPLLANGQCGGAGRPAQISRMGIAELTGVSQLVKVETRPLGSLLGTIKPPDEGTGLLLYRLRLRQHDNPSDRCSWPPIVVLWLGGAEKDTVLHLSRSPVQQTSFKDNHKLVFLLEATVLTPGKPLTGLPAAGARTRAYWASTKSLIAGTTNVSSIDFCLGAIGHQLQPWVEVNQRDTVEILYENQESIRLPC